MANLSGFKFHRKLTLDLLNSLDENDLKFSPHPSVSDFGSQLKHMGRVQEDYISAIETGKIEFTGDASSYFDGELSKSSLVDYLSSLNDKLERAASSSTNKSINWFGEDVPLQGHISRLEEHEVLHHGQWIVFMKSLGKPFPPSWKVWGF